MWDFESGSWEKLSESQEEFIINLDEEIKSIPIWGFDFFSFFWEVNLLVEYDEETQVFTCQFPTKKWNIIFQKKREQNIQYNSLLRKFKTEIKKFLIYYRISDVKFSTSDKVKKILKSQQTSS